MESTSEISGAIKRLMDKNDILDLPTVYPKKALKFNTYIHEELPDGRLLTTVKETVLTIEAANHVKMAAYLTY